MSTDGKGSQKQSFVSWVYSPSWDLIFLHSPVLLAVAILTIRRIWGFESTTWLPTTYTSMIAVSSAVHIALPCAFFFTHSALRDLRAEDPMRWRYVPLAMISTILFLVYGVSYMLPELAFVILALTYLLWTSWHFPAQNFGVMSLYRSAYGRSGKIESWVDRIYCLAYALVLLNVWRLLLGKRFDILYYFGLETKKFDWIAADILPYLASVLFPIYVLIHLLFFKVQFLKLFYAGAIALQTFLFFSGDPLDAICASLIFLFGHHLVEIGLQFRGLRTTVKTEQSSRRKFVYLFAVIAWPVAIYIGYRIYPVTVDLGASAWVPPSEAHSLLADPFAQIFIALFFVSTILHFYVDSWIYDFRDKKIRKAVAHRFLS